MDTVGLPLLVRFVKLVRWYLDETYACNADCVGNCSSNPAGRHSTAEAPGDKWARGQCSNQCLSSLALGLPQRANQSSPSGTICQDRSHHVDDDSH